MENTPPQSHHMRHALAWIFGLTVGLFVAIFLSLLVYYLWQFKYGTTEQIVKTNAEFTSQKFTATGGSDVGPKAPADWKKYIYPTSPILGNPASPVTIIEFIDFECPFSQEGYSLFKSVVDTYGGAVRIVFKYLPLTSIHPNALVATEAAACANEQKKFWQYYHYLFGTKKLTVNDLTAAAVATGLDTKAFSTCLNTEKYRPQIEKDVNDAIELGVRGTPTYFINEQVIEGVADRATWDTAILHHLKK